ncbi:13413_t:CDS:2 [Dentiscutata erythropus]|uniref:13413_t:CDS:1 n=1 Tax=Dentiscutata erythropus TaxID=1348616 RepID=A0A9N9EW70_9GLOM|nr:13413_t:CDS:2 [Dentiscutata erythropus]
MYYGSVSLEHLDGPDSIALLIASDELELRRLCIHVQTHIKNTLNDWLSKNLMFILDITSKHEDFDILREHVLGIVCRDPHLIFGVNNDYLLLSESTMIHLLKRDDLGMDEIDIWEYLIKWGIEHATSLSQNNHDLNNWSKDDFAALEETLHNCIPLIRFFQISSIDLYDKVRVPYKKILPKQLNEDIIKYFMKPGCELTTRILPSRLTIIDSTIVKAIHAGLISSWIDGIVHDNDRDYDNAVNSFVFSFNVNDDLKNALLSKVVMASNAIYYSTSNGPCFGNGDLWMTGTFGSSSRTSYEHSIMDVPNFFANDYEVFQVQQR